MRKRAASMALGLMVSLAMGTAAADGSGVLCSHVKTKAVDVTASDDTYVAAHGNLPALDAALASSAYVTRTKTSSSNSKEWYALQRATQQADRSISIRLVAPSNGSAVHYFCAPS